MTVHNDLTFIAGIGHATECIAYRNHRPKPLRYVWHHILPQACGGQTVKDNLVPVCDNCHYAIHALMATIKRFSGDTNVIARKGTALQRVLARAGWVDALAAGTTNLIPNEGGLE